MLKILGIISILAVFGFAIWTSVEYVKSDLKFVLIPIFSALSTYMVFLILKDENS